VVKTGRTACWGNVSVLRTISFQNNTIQHNSELRNLRQPRKQGNDIHIYSPMGRGNLTTSMPSMIVHNDALGRHLDSIRSSYSHIYRIEKGCRRH
jgi:hypothetical protein